MPVVNFERIMEEKKLAILVKVIQYYNQMKNGFKWGIAFHILHAI